MKKLSALPDKQAIRQSTTETFSLVDGYYAKMYYVFCILYSSAVNKYTIH